MTQQIINVGTAINDGTGDPARVAFTHCNENFTELYTLVRPTGQTIEYQFNNTTTEPPASGQIRFNQATQSSTTKLWVSHTTASGINIKQFLSAATTGAKLVLQDKNDNTNYIKFDVTGPPVDKTTYWEFAVAVTASGGTLPNAAILAAVTASAGASVTDIIPQCGRLGYVSTTALSFKPYNGDRIKINGSVVAIPSVGITGLGNTGVFVNGTAGQNLAASTLYWVFAFVNSGTITADFRTAATHATSSTAGNEGVEILTGNDSKTLIGMALTNVSSQFQDSTSVRGVISWFNRRSIQGIGPNVSGVALGSATMVELSSASRINFLTWADEAVEVHLVGSAFGNAVINIYVQILADGAAALKSDVLFTCGGNGYWENMGASGTLALSEGSHNVSPAGAVSTGVGTYYVNLTAMIRG